jgi:hypothetical protein
VIVVDCYRAPGRPAQCEVFAEVEFPPVHRFGFDD